MAESPFTGADPSFFPLLTGSCIIYNSERTRLSLFWQKGATPDCHAYQKVVSLSFLVTGIISGVKKAER